MFNLGFNWESGQSECLFIKSFLERLFQPELGPDWLEALNSCGSPKPSKAQARGPDMWGFKPGYPQGPLDRHKTEDSTLVWKRVLAPALVLP